MDWNMDDLAFKTIDQMWNQMGSRNLTIILGVISIDGNGERFEVFAKEGGFDMTILDLADELVDYVIEYNLENTDEDNLGIDENYDED